MRHKPMRSRMALLTFTLFAALLPAHLHAANGERTLVKQAKPVYPELARKMRVYGSITLTISILPDGRVRDIVLESGHPLLVNAAKDAVKQWKYATGPDTTTTSVTVRFDLPE